MRQLLRRLRFLIQQRRLATGLAEEMAFHREMKEHELEQTGITADDARLAARRAFGSATLAHEQARDVWSIQWIDAVMQDLRHSMRALRRSPGFTFLVVLTLGLGIGANTAIFTLTNALLLRPIGVPDPTRLIHVAASEAQGRPGGLLTPMLDVIRDQRLFAGACGFITPSVIVDIHGRTTPIQTHMFTGDCFTTLGVRPAIGRLLTLDDDRSGAAHAVVLSYDTWVQEYGENPSVLGETINIDGAQYPIVGVSHRGFNGVRVGAPARLFIPVGNLEAGLAAYFPPRELLPVEVLARLPPGMSADTARAQLSVGWQRWLEASAPSRLGPLQRDRYLHRELHVADASTGIDNGLRQRFRPALLALLAMSGVVLVATCINVANLLLARLARQRREASVRIALGASRPCLLRSAAMESGLLLAAGAVLGVLFAYELDVILMAILSGTSPEQVVAVTPDVHVLAFTGVTCAVAFLTCALIPAWQASRIHTASLSAASVRGLGDRTRLRRAAVVAQVALTIVLVATGALFVDMLREFRNAPLGLSVDRVIGGQLSPLPGGYPRGFVGNPYYRDLLDRVARLPGIDNTALSYHRPLTEAPSAVRVAVSGSEFEMNADPAFVNESFFATMGIPLMTGVSFGRTDQPTGIRTAVVSESVARALFGSSDILGRTIRVGPNPVNQAVTVIGVARDAVLSNPQRRNPNVVYLNFWQFGQPIQGYATLLVRTAQHITVSADALQRAVREGGHEYVSLTHTLPGLRDAALVQERLLATLSTAFAVLGLTLAAVGLYGLLSFSIAQRTSELGIRIALGATRTRILGLVLRQSSMLIIVGTLIGLPMAWAANHTAAALLYSRDSVGVMPAAVAVALMAAVGCGGVWLPARRATRVDPLVALRHEN